MAASNKSTGLIVTTVIFALIAIICGAGWYMTFDEARQQQRTWAKASEDLKKEQNATKELDTQVQGLKTVIGRNVPQTGSPDQAADETTAIGGALTDIGKLNGQVGMATNVKDATAAVVNKLTQLESDVKTKDAAIDDTNKKINALEGEYQKRVDGMTAARDQAVKDKEDALKSKAEEVKAKQAQIDKLNKDLKAIQAEYDEAKAGWDNEKKKFETEVEQYNAQIDKLRDKLKNLTRVSFETPDGYVRWVDNTARTVSLNIGSADGLRVRTTFSVYRKDNNGMARGAEDIKGQLEVTKIIGSHQSEARILEDDIYSPITKGDPVYTPLWSPGRAEVFAIVGNIDLDRDGISDRERFRDIIASAGATLSHEVLEDGKRLVYQRYPEEFIEWSEETGPSLDSQVKYLIIADIPDPSKEVIKDKEESAKSINGKLKAMRDEARRIGIDEIRMSDFLSYIGFIPERRLFIPGTVDRPFNLKNGAASAGVDEGAGDRTSAGSVSGLFTRSKRLKAQSGDNSGSKYGNK